MESARFNDRIFDTLCVGRKHASDRDETVFLFVRMRDGKMLTAGLRGEMEDAIRESLSPRHVPKHILEVEDIPVTTNGKKVEIVVKGIISGSDVKVSNTVANMKCHKSYAKYRNWESHRDTKV